jgi:hypothetical protein
MLERNAVRLVQTAIDTSLGWGESQVALCEPPTDQLREMCRWKGSGGRLLRVRREAFGFGFQRIRAQSHVVIDLTTRLTTSSRAPSSNAGRPFEPNRN